MTRVGNHTMTKTTEGYVLTTIEGKVVGTYPNARTAMEAGVALTVAAYKAKQRG